MANTTEEIFERHYVSSEFEWRVPRMKYQSLVSHLHDRCESPPYAFCNTNWTVRLKRSLYTVIFEAIRHQVAHCHDNYVECQIIIVENDGEEYSFHECKWTANTRNWKYRMYFMKEDFLLRNAKGKIDVKIVCFLKCYHCKPDPHTVLSNRSNSLVGDLMHLFDSGEGSDLIINVEGRNFKVHKCIMRARSPVFFSMFNHAMLESKSGRVDITDCDAEAFQKFLEYVYSGNLNCSQDIVYDLYYITDKYAVSEVKTECVKFMTENLSVENFCDTVTFSLRHEELAVLESAHQFFACNSKAIIRTDGWLSFLQDKPAAANDFFMKLLDRGGL